jgi:cytidylate kinase
MTDESIKETCTKITIYVRTTDVERAKRIAKRELHGSYQVILRNAITRGLRDKGDVR